MRIDLPIDEKRFFNFWESKAKEIKSMKLDKNQINNIWFNFSNQSSFYLNHVGDIQRLWEVLSDMEIAVQNAFSNYRESNRSFWSNIFGGLTGPILKMPRIFKE